MITTPKAFYRKNRKSFLIKNLNHIANSNGQTLQVFYPRFCKPTHRIYLLFHRVNNQATQLTALGYFILSMHCSATLLIALMSAQ